MLDFPCLCRIRDGRRVDFALERRVVVITRDGTLDDVFRVVGEERLSGVLACKIGDVCRSTRVLPLEFIEVVRLNTAQQIG
jgi:hypothetical protein